MKKLILLAGILLGLFLGSKVFGQQSNIKYPNIDSLQTIVYDALTNFDKYEYSLLNSNIQTKDTMLYHFFDVFTGNGIFLDTMESKECIKTMIDMDLQSFIKHDDYYVTFLPRDDMFYNNGIDKWAIISKIKSDIYDNVLYVEFYFNSANQFHFVKVTHCK